MKYNKEIERQYKQKIKKANFKEVKLVQNKSATTEA